MKKFIIFGVVLALLVPSLAMAATEFSLGGFIKMDMMWDSDNGVGKNMNAAPARNNTNGSKHGRLKFTAQGSRFSFTIKGPDLWGAKTTGFIEMDFDAAERQTLNLGNSASNSYTPRLRHAMFRFNWPTSELLFGQYFSMFCEWYAESAEDGPLQLTGTPTARMAQVRFTQTFLSDWTVAALLGDPSNTTLGGATYNNANINNGQYAESPQVQAKIKYEHDFWGKAAYYGKPIPFTVQFVGGWQRSTIRNSVFTSANVFGENNYTSSFNQNGVLTNLRVQNQNVNPWLAMGSLFIPVIPTSSANLAGTASILTQWWIGQGVEAFGFTGVASNKYRFNNMLVYPGTTATWNYDTELLNKFGGFVEGQYYFNNQWFINALYGISKTFGVAHSQLTALGGQEMAFLGDNPSTIQQMSATLWYRPIQAIKFGLQYSYLSASYPQLVSSPAVNFGNTSNFGDNHRVEFVGFFYF
jgi:hypothetical protein